MKTKKIIVFDFDKTLTKEDTLFGFFVFAGNKDFYFYFKVIYYVFLMILTKVKWLENRKLKSKGIKLFLSKLNKETLNFKFKNYHKKIQFNSLYSDLEYDEDTKYYVLSASFQEYIHPIFPNFVTVFGSTIKYKNDVANDLLINCYKENKVRLLKENNIEVVDTFYTDSISDFEVAKMAKEIIIVKGDSFIRCSNIEDFINYLKK